MTPEEAALFREAVKSVRPLKDKSRIDLSQHRPDPQFFQPHTGQTGQAGHAESDAQAAHHHLPDSPATEEIVDPHESLFYIRDHLPLTTVRKFRKGELCSDFEVDLHGLKVEQARQELSSCIHEAISRNLRCFRVIHGKGRGSADQIPILKSKVNHWLRQRPEVLAFCSARQRDGGTGAVYVLLKKQ